MQLRKGLRGVAAVGLSAATLLSLCISGVANADNVPISGATGKITVSNAQAGHELVPVKLADYQAAQSDTTGDLTNVAFATVADPIKGWTSAAAEAANAAPISGDPMNWVAQNMNDGSNAAPWDGKLRSFVTKLVADHRDGLLAQGLTPKSFTANGAVKRGDVVFNVNPGIYLIIDRTPATAGASSAIPMLVSSTINSYTTLKGKTIGTVVMKNEDIKFEKKMTKVNDGTPVKNQVFKVGDTLTYTLTTKGPNLVGYTTPYYFHVQDYPSKGLEFVRTNSIMAGGTSITLQPGEVSQGDAATKPVHYIDWNLSRYITQDMYGKDIVITYTMKIKEGGTQTNSASLFTPANPGNPPADPNQVPDLDNPDTTHKNETPAEPSKPDDGNDGVPTNPVINPFNLKFKHFVKGSSPEQKISGARYKVYNVTNGNSPLSFTNSTNGWVNSTGDLNAVSEIYVPSTGFLDIKGLSAGTYKFDMTTPGNSQFALLHTFTVTITNDGKFTNTADVWNLVEANTIKTADNILGELDVPDAATASQLPLTGGAGIILVVALAVLAGGAVVVTSVIRRRALMTAKK